MTKNEIKKELYKQKPDAVYIGATNDKLIYTSFLLSDIKNEEIIAFKVPKNEAQGFDSLIKAQLLIRWLV